MSASAAEISNDEPSSPAVVVIGTTPLPALGVPLGDVPANVQRASAADLDKQAQANLGEFLGRNLVSVSINSSQGNPYQADVNFRGFTASPILGTQQGLSVFQDGVRINEPFGDAVNWDLIPQAAIDNLQLVPGSNPVFGLNTLGGALTLQTKRGKSHPGCALDMEFGSFGRLAADATYGGRTGPLDYFVTANVADDEGWAEHNPSRVRQFFGSVGWTGERTDLNMNLTLADNTLDGTQTLPLSFFREDIRQAYTWPDTNENRLAFLTLGGTYELAADAIASGITYVRRYRNGNVSSNINDDFDPLDPTSPQAANDRSALDQHSYGVSAQLSVGSRVTDRPNQLTIGLSADSGEADFTQDSQDAELTADRSAVGITEFEQETHARTRNRYYGVYAADTFELTPRWVITASGRYDIARIAIEDRSGLAPELNGDHSFSRFNPAIGINYKPTDRLNAYASYNEGSRAPTPIELTCADPKAPCKLPNNFVADPPLDMVLSRTIEAGMRVHSTSGAQWSLAVYRTLLQNDLQFISAGAGATNAGFFQNVGETQRQGLEINGDARWGIFALSAGYSFLDATYRSSFMVNSPSNSAADADGNIAVRTGDRIPGLPRHSGRLRAEFELSESARLGLSANYCSSVYARGDESNQDVNGQVPGWMTVSLDGRVALSRRVDLTIAVSNLFDRKYANFGTMGANWFSGPGHSFDGTNPVDEQFRGPGAPRGAWLGVRYARK